MSGKSWYRKGVQRMASIFAVYRKSCNKLISGHLCNMLY